MSPIKTALCSFGMSGRVFHAPFLHIHPGYELYAVWERSKTEAQTAYPSIRTVKTLEELLADEAVELVIINTPNYTHADYVRKALLAGKHVVVEKPFALTVEEGISLTELAEQQGRQLSVFQNRRYDSDYKTVKKVVEEGSLGEIVEAEIHYDRYSTALSPKLHKEIPGLGTGLLYDLGSHLIDQALQLFGLPEAVFADLGIIRPISKVEDYMEVLLFYSRLRVRLKASYLVREPLPAYILHGSLGSFIKPRADNQEARLIQHVLPRGDDWGQEPEEAWGLLHTEIDGKEVWERIPSLRGDYGEYYDKLYTAIREKGRLPVRPEEAVDGLRVIEAAYRSVAGKMRVALSLCVLLLGMLLGGSLKTKAAAGGRIVVDASGKGDFRTIQEAINSLPATAAAPRIIFVRKGVYNEKLFIEKDNIILEGEDEVRTILTFSQARDAWRCDHTDDWGVATLNLRGSDITLKDLTLANSYGFDNQEDKKIACAADSVTHQKTVGRAGHQMALRSFQTTRLKVIDCILKAYGGDTVSPWNVSEGMFYFSNCTMEGGVDFYCPRGWAYAENCHFVADNGPACIWHDGSADPDSKTVLKNCSFSGYDGFKLGRYHRDAQFYLIHCSFAENMADEDIYQVPTNNILRWGRRIYYYDCHKDGRAFTWYADNLDKAPGSPAAARIDAAWVFRGKWDPVGADSVNRPAELSKGTAASTNAIDLAATVMRLRPDTGDTTTAKWTYEEGVEWKGLESLWYHTGDARYFRYIQHRVDRLVDPQGNIQNYRLYDYSLDNVLNGRTLLFLYKVTGLEKYYKAAKILREQLSSQPRTSEGSFWHKKKYYNQVWLDGLYMAMPFYAEYGSLLHEDTTVFNDITKQFVLIEQHARDARTGLLYHGWDGSGQEKWADKVTGCSPHFWGRAMGWFGMALVDALDYYPVRHPGRDSLIAILRRYATAVQSVQDYSTGLWWDILDRPGTPGNYPEASASCMFVYTLAKGVRMGYLPASFLETAKKGYTGIGKKFITLADNGQTDLQGTVSVSGLGGQPYRDGSYAYYTGEKVVANDPKGMGAFLLAAGEIDPLAVSSLGKGRTVLLDYYYNNEHHKDITGANVRYHYTWEDQANSGFSLFGDIFRTYGMHTDSLPAAPTVKRLKKASIYVIVDPDDAKESPSPNYVNDADIKVIYDWVKEGGVLLLMSNDSGNAEFPHFNRLAEKFGIHFNEDSRNKVIGNKYEMGAFTMTAQDGIFKTSKKIYIKELSTLHLTDPAQPHFTDHGDVIMAVSKVGKGTVFAVGDPWFYNEYLDGRKLPAEYENFKAANDLARWLIEQAK